MNTRTHERQLQLILQKNLSGEKQSTTTIAALAGVLGISPQEIDLYEADKGDEILSLGISTTTMHRLRSSLQTNSGQLRLLGIERLIVERESGEFETWGKHRGVFELETTIDQDVIRLSSNSFASIPGIWQFHVAYLVVTSILGVLAYPYSQFTSLLLISGVCAVGIILAFSRYSVVAYILALAIVFASPVIVFAGLLPIQTVILFLFLIFGATLAHKYLF